MFCTLGELLNHVLSTIEAFKRALSQLFFKRTTPTLINSFLFTLFEFLLVTSAVHEI